MKVPVVVKRSKLSLFLEVDETDRVRDLKEKLAVMVQKRPSDLQLVMVDNKEVMQEKKSLSDYGIEYTKINDAEPPIIGMCYKLSENAGHFEPLKISEATKPPAL